MLEDIKTKDVNHQPIYIWGDSSGVLMPVLSCQDDNSSFKLKSMMRKLVPQNQEWKKRNMKATGRGCSNVAATYGGSQASGPGNK